MSKRHQEEDYGDYVTRCVCGFTHDDGYMICCDGCSVWQHVECMKVDPKNLPDKYLCEMCEPRSVDRKRARQIQIRKREEMSDFDDDDSGSMSTDDGRRSMTHSPNPHAVIKRNKRPRLHHPNQHQPSQQRPNTRVQELKAEARRSKREKEEGKKMKKKSMKYTEPHSPSVSSRMMTGVQTLLTAASALEEQQQSNELWSSSSSPWSDPYETIEHNQYSDELRSFLASQLPQLRQEVIVYTPDEYASLGPFSPCMVRDVAVTRKGVVSEAHIAEDDMVMEYKGKVTLKQVLLGEAGVKSLWKSKPCPFVYHYDRIPNAGICIDARKHGNLARFIRRSCVANSELRYFLVGNELHFGVYASCHISPREEITLPFDFPVEKCDYSIECACNQKNCPVAEGTGGSRSRRASKGNDEEQVQRKSSKGRGTPAHPPPNEDSNSSWTSTGSGHKRKKHRHAVPPVAAPSTTVAVQTQSSKEVSESDSDDQDIEGNKKQKSREERKTEAVWKMFEKMEASERRRQQHLLSEGSHDGDTSPLPQPLTPRTLKERRISSTSSSRKAQLLPSTKPRLSSVSSSMDLLSPEPLDAFSPPLTPSLSVSYPHDLDPPCSLSTASLSSSLPKLSFEVTPYLHPKYLLADFALPRKKAILRQWEMELRGTGTTYPLTSGGGRHWMANSFAMACAHAMEGKRSPRVRGSLKHRWIKRHEDDCKRLNSSGSSSESSSPHHQDEHNILQDALPYKKWFLRRWEESTCSNSIMSNSPHGCLTLLEKSGIMRPVDANSLHELGKDEEEHPLSKQVAGPETPPTSFTLFDDFSDDDFEEVSEKNGRRHVEDKGNNRGGPGHAERNRLAGDPNAFQRSDGDRQQHRESVPSTTPDTEGSDTDHKPLPAAENHQPVDSSPITPSESPPPLAPAPTNTSLLEPDVPAPHFELGQDLLHTDEAKSGADSTLQPATTATVTATTTTTASCNVDVLVQDPVQPEGDVGAGRAAIAEQRADCASSQSSPAFAASTHQDGKAGLTEMVEMELSSPSQFNQVGADLYPSGESPDDVQSCDNLVEGGRSVVDEGSLSEKPCSLLDSLSKPAGKRKMSLLEYRSRARKPAEQRKAPSPSPDRRASSAPSPLANVSAGTITPPIQSPGVSYLSFSSSFLSGSSNRVLSGPVSLNTSVSPATAAPPPVTDGDHSHFEPVSPDEGDHTPQHGDDVAAVHPALTSLQPPGLPPSSVPPPPTMPEQLLPAASSAPMFPVTAPTPPQPQQQQYPLMENRWGQPGMEIAQDPRRAAHALPEMYRPQQQPLPPQVTASPEVIHGCYPGPYPPPPPMMHPPQPAPMMMGQKFGAQRPGFMPPRLQMPHPMYRPPPPPPPHHSNNSPFF